MLLVPALAGCGSGLGPGPMELGGSQGSACAPSSGERVVFGDPFRIAGGASVVVEQLRLIDANGIALEDAFILPIEGDATIGTSSYPPTIGDWEDRVPVTRATVAPGEWMSFALVLKPTGGGDHTTDGFTVMYRLGGTLFEKSNSTSFILAASCSERRDDDEL